MDRQQIVLVEVDSRPQALQRFFGYGDDQLLVLAEPGISHGGERIDELFSRFVANLRRCGSSLADVPDVEARELVATAAASAMDADRELVAEKNGGIAFVVAAACGEAWRVFLLGAFYVLRLGQSGAEEVLVPHSAFREAMARGIPADAARDFAGVSTRAAVPGERFGDEIRVAEVRLASGETLLAMPEPRGRITREEPIKAPSTLDDIHQLTERLRAAGGHLRGDLAMWSRTLFAVRCA